jgi:hypothetical protein
MLRIGGDVRGFVANAELAGLFNRPYVSLPHGLALVRMTPEWMRDIDDLTRQPVSVLVTGFDLLTAGVIEYAESLSQHGVLGYVERRWGLEIVDSAVAWHRGKTVSGPSGTSVTADSPDSAFSAVLVALGMNRFQQAEVLAAVADL